MINQTDQQKLDADEFLMKQITELNECPNCRSTDVSAGGDDCDGDVSCNVCGLCTGTFYGTASAINAWNNRNYIDKWYFLDYYDEELMQAYDI